MESNNKENKPFLDTTGTYFRLKLPANYKQKKNTEEDEKTKETEKQRQEKLFTDHAFRFLACADTILAESRLACVEIIHQGTGIPYLGTYITLWTTCPHAVRFTENGLLLMLDDSNSCEGILEDGTLLLQQPFGQNIDIHIKHLNANVRYWNIKQAMNEKPYTIDEAVRWVESRLTDDLYRKAINDFSWKMHEMQLDMAKREAQEEQISSDKEADLCRLIYVESVLREKIKLVRQIVADYRQLEKHVNEQIEPLARTNAELEERYARNELSRRDFNIPHNDNKNKIEDLERKLLRAESDAYELLFPEDAPERQPDEDFYFHKVENLITIDSLSKFLEQEDNR